MWSGDGPVADKRRLHLTWRGTSRPHSDPFDFMNWGCDDRGAWAEVLTGPLRVTHSGDDFMGLSVRNGSEEGFRKGHANVTPLTSDRDARLVS